jgi:putative ATP-binding cassette transporter
MAELFAILLRYGRPRSLLLAVVAGIASGLCGTAMLALINRLMNLEPQEPRPTWLLWSFIGLCAAIPAVRILSSYLFQNLGTRASHDLRMELSRRILSAPLRRLEEVGPHGLLTALHRDVNILADAVTALPGLCMNTALVTGCLCYMGWLSPVLLLAVLLLIVLGVASYQFPILLARRREHAVHELHETLFDQVRGLTQGTKELKMHGGRRTAFLSLLETTSGDLRRLTLRVRLIMAAGNSWGSILSFIVIGLLFFLAPARLGVGREALTGYALLLLFLTGPFEMILGTIPDLTRASVAAQKIRQLGVSLLDPHPQEGAVAAAQSKPGWTDWELENVTHTYYREAEDDNFVLGPVSLSFRPGEIVFLIGGNGSGKTTLAKLLLGLYVPDTGTIRFNGKEVMDGDSREAYRQCFSVVFSDFFLFSSLLGLDGSPDTDGRARDYLRRLQLQHKVRVEEGQLSTTDLSQGQRKRLALLTAFLEDRPIYLFDEWAADQDPHFKEIFYEQILPELRDRGRTVIVISHDDRYYGMAERIIKLESGRVVSDDRVAVVSSLSGA